MNIKLTDLKPVCANLSSVIDNNAMSEIATTIQLYAKDDVLNINYTNKQYFVSSKIPCTAADAFNVVIKADTFIKLISKLTDDDIEILKSNDYEAIDIFTNTGKYTFATMDAVNAFSTQFNNFAIPDTDVAVSYSINNGVLKDIIEYSNTEFSKVPDAIAKSNVVYRMCYLDSQGSIAMSGGSCVYNANVDVETGVYLTDKLLKLLKLFNCDTEYDINIKTGTAVVLNSVCQQKIKFTSDNMEISAILPSTDKVKLPIDMVRDMANKELPHSVNVDKSLLAQVLDRFSIFVDGTSVQDVVELEFRNNDLKCSNSALDNFDIVNYVNSIECEPFTVKVCLSELLTTLGNYGSNVIIGFGVNSHIILHNDTVTNIIPCIK